MKCECGSPKLQAINIENLDFVFNFVAGKWIISDPEVKKKFSPRSKPFIVHCFACNGHFELENLHPQYSPGIEHKEIVLDLDHTLIYAEYDDKEEYEGSDLIFKDPNSNFKYFIYARPHLKEFIKELEKRFNKINFYTAAVEWYAEAIITFLDISKEKIGFIKHRSHTEEGRHVKFGKELLKLVDNSLIIEDKPHVIKGFNNVIFRVSPYFRDQTSDKALLKALNLLNKKEQKLK
jgi:TFIIF-interacting CTD phosphatase-like protein